MSDRTDLGVLVLDFLAPRTVKILCCFSHPVDSMMLEPTEQIKPIYMDRESCKCKVTKDKVTKQAPSEFLVSESMRPGCSGQGLAWGLFQFFLLSL